MTAPVLEKPPTSAGDDLIHIVCDCSEDVALCGTDVSEDEWRTEEWTSNDCLVCVDLWRQGPCRTCGG